MNSPVNVVQLYIGEALWKDRGKRLFRDGFGVNVAGGVGAAGGGLSQVVVLIVDSGDEKQT